MSIGVLLTDLDGTLLEPDGTLRPEARDAVALLAGRGIPICPVTSKTAAELDAILADLALRCPAGFENGAGVRHDDGRIDLSGAAVPVAELRRVLDRLRRVTGAPARSIEELDDEELARITGLTGDALARARRRHATLPLVVAARWDARLRKALPEAPRVRLVRGNRFLHLQGVHDKADVVPRLLALVGATAVAVACGDAPNDLDLLGAASVRVIIPGRRGPNAALARRFPDAVVAPFPHGRGWAAAVTALAGGTGSASSMELRSTREDSTMSRNRRRQGSASDG